MTKRKHSGFKPKTVRASDSSHNFWNYGMDTDALRLYLRNRDYKNYRG